MKDFYNEKHIELTKVAFTLQAHFHQIKELEGEDFMIEYAHKTASDLLEVSGIWDKASCSKGCSFCCHDQIFVAENEGRYIKKMIKKNKIKVNRSVLKKQKKARSYKELKWANKKCSLLDENGLCSIYEFRPLVCRTHNSIEDPKFCNKNEYPNRNIKEGRSIPVEAIVIALTMVEGKAFTDEPLTSLHEIIEL